MKRVQILSFLFLCISSIYAQDTLSSGRLVFEIGHANKPVTYDTIWYAPKIYRSEWGLTDYQKMLNYSREGKDTVITTKKEFDMIMKEQMKIKSVRTDFSDKDTLTILGILCTKAKVTVTKEDDSIVKYDVYFSPRIGGKQCNYSSEFYNIPGFPIYTTSAITGEYSRLIEYTHLNPSDIFIPNLFQTRIFKRMAKKHQQKNKH